MTKIYHNPRCSKSRQTLEMIKEKGETPEIISYLETGYKKDELIDILKKLGKTPSEIIRKNEDIYKKLISENPNPDEKTILNWMVENPILVERPIVVKGNNARLGRPPESVLEIL